MRMKGEIASWNDEKGYGFISPMRGGDRVFAHIKAFVNRGRRPAVGDAVTFSMSTDARGRHCAKEAIIAGVPKTEKSKRSSALPNVLAAGFLLIVVSAVSVSAIPMQILLLYLVVSTAAFGAYALDKSAAKRGAWRTSESTLHLLALVGGWPGALIAQSRLRHKSRKQPFRAVFWATVVMNCAAFVWLFTPEGAKAWQSVVSLVINCAEFIWLLIPEAAKAWQFVVSMIA
ncbi:cold-shock DNA-binding domain protein [Nitrosococcus watsonii C-113]|uniref:Cold-shock DNA-binding domain protein n=2 Tax=Nitrosococcus TaxID=1227 RepID=D8KBH6_NITWC|nr:cold-shock DNA-binding domain protein [Nitrosococcus watsonii C-113]